MRREKIKGWRNMRDVEREEKRKAGEIIGQKREDKERGWSKKEWRDLRKENKKEEHEKGGKKGGKLKGDKKMRRETEEEGKGAEAGPWPVSQKRVDWDQGRGGAMTPVVQSWR